VGLSLGSADPLDDGHLAKLDALARRIEPAFISEHLSWSRVDGRHANELLPMPLTAQAAAHLAARVGEAQERLGRRSWWRTCRHTSRSTGGELAEWEFVAEVAKAPRAARSSST